MMMLPLAPLFPPPMPAPLKPPVAVIMPPLNDSFWVVPKGFTGTFAQYNLYENRFSEILSLVA
ncbi:hypothetical protein AALC17_20470, partial [Oscillospiraceae bacterium 38-13]